MSTRQMTRRMKYVPNNHNSERFLDVTSLKKSEMPHLTPIVPLFYYLFNIIMEIKTDRCIKSLVL